MDLRYEETDWDREVRAIAERGQKVYDNSKKPSRTWWVVAGLGILCGVVMIVMIIAIANQ